MEQETEYIYICEWCREQVDPHDPAIVQAVERKEAVTFGGREWIDGLGVYFHSECFPGGPSYRLA